MKKRFTILLEEETILKLKKMSAILGPINFRKAVELELSAFSDYEIEHELKKENL